MAHHQVACTLDKLQSVSKKELDLVRHKIKTNLAFIANDVLRDPSQPPLSQCALNICDHLLHCDDSRPFEEWAADDEIQTHIILSFRGSLKSHLAAINMVQCILCEKDIRILLLFGKLDKALEILQLIKQYFLHPVLAFLFPEFAEGVKIDGLDFFTTPARHRTDLRDPTLAIASGRAVKAGSHCDILLCDDYTNEITGRSAEATQRAIEQFNDVLIGVPEPQTHVIFLGSVWAVVDLPHVLKETEGDRCDYFEQPVWTLRTDGTESEIAARQAREQSRMLEMDDVIWTWPERVRGPEYWFGLYKKDFASFTCQYLLQAEQQLSDVRFRKALVQRQLCPSNKIPRQKDSRFFINLDLAGTKSKRDETVLVVGNWDLVTRALVIVDSVIRQGMSTDALARMIVDYYLHYLPYRFRIEKTPGVEHLQTAIDLAATASGHDPRNIRLDWKAPSTASNAKKLRIQVFQKALVDNKVFIWNNEHLRSFCNKLLKYNPTAPNSLDDVADSSAQLYCHYEPIIGVENIPIELRSCPSIQPAPLKFDSDGPPNIGVGLPRMASQRYNQAVSAARFDSYFVNPYYDGKGAGDPDWYKEQLQALGLKDRPYRCDEEL